MPDGGTSADGVASGKRLIRLEGDRGLSLGEQIVRAWHRVSWRGPLRALRLGGKAPIQLVAVPEDHILGDMVRGHALLDGRLRWMQQEIGFNDIADSGVQISHTLAEYLHSFSWLRDLSSVAPRTQAAPVAENLIKIWLDRFGDQIEFPAWRPDLSGLRILYATAHAPLALSEPAIRVRLLKLLSRSALHLAKTAKQADEGLARISAWGGIVAAALLFPDGRAQLSGGEAGFVKALGRGVTEDGGLVSRSPVEQFDLLSLLLLIRAAYEAAPSKQVPQFITEAIARTVPALLSATHGDGGLAGFQGSPPIESHRIATAVAASGTGARPSNAARDWGYQQVIAGPVHLIIDAGPPPANRHARCGCASALAIEISDGAERLIVSCGGASVLTGNQDERLRAGLRSTAAHSVMSIADANSNVVLKNGSLGTGVSELNFTKDDLGDFIRLSGSHDGYAQQFDFEARRVLSIDKLGRAIRGEEILVPITQRKRGKAQPVAIRFHAGAGVAIIPSVDEGSVEFQLPSGRIWRFTCSGAALNTEPSLWIGASGKSLQTAQLCVTAEAPAGGFILSWTLERLSTN